MPPSLGRPSVALAASVSFSPSPMRNKGPMGDWPDRWLAKAGTLGSFEVSSLDSEDSNVAELGYDFDELSVSLALRIFFYLFFFFIVILGSRL